jgi:hypothetical protein
MKVRPNMTLDASGGYDAFRGSPVTTTTAFYPGGLVQITVNEPAGIGGNAKIPSLGMRYNF